MAFSSRSSAVHRGKMINGNDDEWGNENGGNISDHSLAGKSEKRLYKGIDEGLDTTKVNVGYGYSSDSNEGQATGDSQNGKFQSSVRKQAKTTEIDFSDVTNSNQNGKLEFDDEDEEANVSPGRTFKLDDNNNSTNESSFESSFEKTSKTDDSLVHLNKTTIDGSKDNGETNGMANIIKVDRTRRDASDSDVDEAGGAAIASMQLSSEDERQRKATGEAPALDMSSEDDENRDEEKTDNISNRESESMSTHQERIPSTNSGTLIQSEGNMKRDNKETEYTSNRFESNEYNKDPRIKTASVASSISSERRQFRSESQGSSSTEHSYGALENSHGKRAAITGREKKIQRPAQNEPAEDYKKMLAKNQERGIPRPNYTTYPGSEEDRRSQPYSSSMAEESDTSGNYRENIQGRKKLKRGQAPNSSNGENYFDRERQMEMINERMGKLQTGIPDRQRAITPSSDSTISFLDERNAHSDYSTSPENLNPLENGEDWKQESRWQKQSIQQTNFRVDRSPASNRKSSRASNNAINSHAEDNNSFFYSETAGYPG